MTGTISGTNGNDTLYGTSGNDTILGKAGNDVITAGNGNDQVDGGSGNDTISAGNGNDDVDGGSGNDTIDGGAGNDRLDGDDGNDTIDGGAGNDRIDGGDGNDVLVGGSGHDLITGDDGDDTITGGAGNDIIHGGDGTDTAVFAGNYATYDILNLHGLVLIQGQDGTDLVLDVEFLKFGDGSYNVATHIFTPTTPASPLVSVVATDGAGTETIDGTDFTFTFHRTGDVSQSLTVNYSIMPAPVDGATPGVDLQPVTGTITFAAGSSTAVLQFSAIDDAIVENTELFSVVVGVGAGYQVDIPNATAGGQIIDNDAFPPAVVSLTPATVETTEGGSLTFTFTRTGGNPAAPLTINYIVNDGPPLGGATRADGDFSYPSGIQQLTFAAGQTVATITVVTNDDANVETDESFPVLLAGGVDYTVDLPNSGSAGLIHDNDVAATPVVTVVATDGVGTEASGDEPDFIFTFTRTGDLSQPLAVNYGIIPAPIDGATPGVDFFNFQPSPIIFAPGSATVLLAFNALDDMEVENIEHFAVVLQPGAGYTFSTTDGTATANATIVSDDVAANPLVSVAATDGVGTETIDGTDFTFTFSRTGSTANALTVNYSIFPAPVDGATPGADFPAQTGTITFAAGSATAVLSFDAIHDAVVENTEFFSVVVGAGVGYDVDTPNATANASIADGTIVGTNAAETLTGTNDPDAILGLGGDDGLIGGLGADYLDGGAGFDRAIYTNAGGAVNIQLAAGTATIGAVVDTLRSIEFARGTAFGDVYNATGFGPASTPNASSEGNNLNGFEGLGGSDQITGNGNTRIEFTNATARVTVTFNSIVPGPGGGGGGSATGDLSVGTDTFSGVSAVRGSQHDDLIVNFGTGNNTFDGQGGFDTVSYANAGAAVTVNLQTGNASGGGGNDVLRDNTGAVTIESAIGSGFNDTFIASGNNRFDGGFGSDTLNLNNAVNNVVTAISIETINGGSGDDTVTFVVNDGSVNQTINLGGGTNTLNLDGTSTSYSFTLFGVNQVNGHAGAINDNVNVLNNAAGTVFDFGAGNADELHFGNSVGVAVFTTYNIENVFGSLSNPDQIHIGGNAGGTTTVTAGLGPDQIWASPDADHFRFTMTGDSPNDIPFGGQRDLITDFDAAEDTFVFDQIPGATSIGWVETNFGGADIVLVDLNGDGSTDGMGNYFGYEMAIELQDHVGTLTNANFLLA